MPVGDATAFYDGSGQGFVSAQDGIDATTRMYRDTDYWRSPEIPVGNRWTNNNYISALSFRSTSAQCWASPFWVPETMTISACSLYVTSAATAGQTIRIAFYNHHANGWQPGTRIADAGTVAIDTTGIKTISSLSITLPKGIVWTTTIAQSTVGTSGSCYGGFSLLNASSTSLSAAILGGASCYSLPSTAAPSDFTGATLQATGTISTSFEFTRSA